MKKLISTPPPSEKVSWNLKGGSNPWLYEKGLPTVTKGEIVVQKCAGPLFRFKKRGAGCRDELMKVKEESEKVGLELNIQKTKIMASDPITSW